MSRNLKNWQRRFGNLTDMEPYHHHLDLRLIDDLDDEGFAYIMGPVKGVNMLDLNETEITNVSIKLLTGLQYVNELGAKGCSIDNGCIEDLNKITSLELLHVKNTGITIDGLLQLNCLVNLKRIFFSADDIEGNKEKLLQLKAMHPACEFVIDGKPYYCDSIDFFIYVLAKQPYTYRVKIKNQALDCRWSNWLGYPSDTYIEAEAQGPYRIDDIEWVEINPVEKKVAGGLVPEREFDHSPAIIKLLETLAFPFMLTDGIISVYLVKKDLSQ